MRFKKQHRRLLRQALLSLPLLCLMTFQIQCSKQVPPQTACGYVQNEEAQRVSWKGQLPIKLYFDSGIPPQFKKALQDALDTWNKTAGRTIFTFVGVSTGTTPKQDGTSVVYWMPNWNDKPSQQANTTIFWVNNQIIEADVRVNAQNFQYSTDLAGGTVDVQSLLTHEFGHVLGLKHEDSQPSVMATYLPNAFDRRDLKATDAASLKCEY